jgi:hypothetical protein
VINYDTKSNVLSLGLNVRPAEKLDFGLQLNWVDSQAAMQPFDLSAPEFTARVPLISLDFSETHTNSDLDTSQVDARLNARYAVNEQIFVRGFYRYVDFEDAAPYLFDATGRNHLFGFSLGWNF